MRGFQFAAQASLTVLGLLLAGCGDGGGGSVASTPVPTYTKIADMTGNRTFQTAGVTYSASQAGFSNGASNAFGSGVTVAYTASSDSYTLTAPDGASQSFGPAELQAPNPSAPNTILYVKTNGATSDGLNLIVPTTTGGLPLSYTVIGIWGTIDTSNNTSTFRIALGGAPTIASDMPKTGTANYAVGVGGSAAVTSQSPLGVPTNTSYSLSGTSSGTFAANFGAGTIQTSLVLAGTGGLSGPPGAPSAVQNFGLFTGTGQLTSGGPGFSGTLTGTSVFGVFSGAFFGPQALETGYVWSLNGPSFSGVGVVTGVKQ